MTLSLDRAARAAVPLLSLLIVTLASSSQAGEPPSPAAAQPSSALPPTQEAARPPATRRAAPAPSRAGEVGRATRTPRRSITADERFFEGDCPGEVWRRVELDASGRTVRYLRGGYRAGSHNQFTVALTYGADGQLTSVSYREADGPERVAGSADAAAAAGIPPGLVTPLRGEDASIGLTAQCDPP